MKLFDTTKIPLLGKALDVYALRQKVISSNIANIATVGYRAKSVSFEDQMSGAMQESALTQTVDDPGHIAGVTQDPTAAGPKVVEEPAGGADALASGLNDVDIDGEMAGLAKTQLQFKFAARLLTTTFRDIQDSIRGEST